MSRTPHPPIQPDWVWGIEATIAPQPLYRPTGLSERIWARRQLKYMAKGTKVVLVPFLVHFFHRREEDYANCTLCPTSNWLRRGGGAAMRVSGTGRMHQSEFFFEENRIALFWLSKMRVVEVRDSRIVTSIMERVFFAWWFAEGDIQRRAWISAWAASDVAYTKWEEIRTGIEEWQCQEL